MGACGRDSLIEKRYLSDKLLRRDGMDQKVSVLSDLRSLRSQTVRKLDVSGKGEAYLPSWGDLRESWYDERLERE